MKAELEDLAEMSKRATEREIETEVVHVFKQIGWPCSQINQDVPISDKGADKADIVLRLNGVPIILVEVKKHGQLRDADNQVNRYCRLLRPSPKLAFLTDGISWMLYYVGQIGAVPIQEVSALEETADVAAMLASFNPISLSALLQSGVFQYLDIVEEGLQERSEDTQKHLRQFFTSTVKTLLMPNVDTIKVRTSKVSSSVILADHPPVFKEQIASQQSVVKPSAQGDGISKEYNPLSPPPLGFMAHVSASFSGSSAKKWSDLLRIAVKSVIESGKTIQDIQRLTSINLQSGHVTVKGYSYIPGINVSVQGQSADQSWQNALKLAQAMNCAIEANFRWHDKEKAAHPGESGSLRWQP